VHAAQCGLVHYKSQKNLAGSPIFRVPTNSTSVFAPLLPHPVAFLHFGAQAAYGVLRTSISRESYDEKSKEFRFRIYQQCLDRLGDIESGCALVAHHEDDANKNRSAELGTGNIVHINGMSNLSTLLGVYVVRPLLAVWNSDLVHFRNALAFATCRTPRPNGVVAVRYGRLLTKLQHILSVTCLFCLTSLEQGLLLLRTLNCVSPSKHVLNVASTTCNSQQEKDHKFTVRAPVNTTYALAPAISLLTSM